MKHPIYLDYQASTPVAPEVLATLADGYKNLYGNPSSLHRAGLEAKAALDKSRRQIARFFDVSPDCLYFTSGATEANNLVIQGLAAGRSGGHILTVSTEHKSVLAPIEHLVGKGFEATFLPVDGDGMLDLALLEASLRPDTFLISIMMVNNETGVIHPIAKIAEIARKHGILFHCDATQAVTTLNIKPRELGIDLMSLSGHKIYGPKGVGLLYVDTERVGRKLGRLTHGGSQENGLRGGTENLPAICGLATAFQVLEASRERDREEAIEKKKAFLEALAPVTFRLNGSAEHCVPTAVNISLEGVKAGTLMRELDHLHFSSGSACSGSAPSHVLTAMGVPSERIQESFRVGFGRFTSVALARQAAEEIVGFVKNVPK